MEREDLEHIIRAAADATNLYEFIIVGSQSILGTIPDPPFDLKVSMEADIYPLDDPEKSELIEGSLGEGSRFHELNGYYAQGVGPETSMLPQGWMDRLHRVQSRNTNLKVGLCLDVLDLFMAKAYANRDKDREFNMALLQHGFVKLEQAIDTVAIMPIDDKKKRDLRARIRRWARLLEERGNLSPKA